MPNPHGRYPNFDVLRLALALEVAYAHIVYLSTGSDWPAFVMAVPAFLGISGFLVLQSYDRTGSWPRFIWKRALRVLPAAFASLALCLVLFGPQMVLNSLVYWLSGGLYYLPGPSNGPMWSLTWEEIAYVALALLWLGGAYSRPWVIWLLLGLSLVVAWVAIPSWPFTPTILFLAPAFFVGNLMYLYRDQLGRISPIIPWIVLPLMLQWRFSPDARLFGGAALAVVQAASVVWIGFSGAAILPAKWRVPDISYGIYIYHIPLLLWLRGTFPGLTVNQLVVALPAVLVPLCLASWYLIEKPALSLKDTPFRQRPAAIV